MSNSNNTNSNNTNSDNIWANNESDDDDYNDEIILNEESLTDIDPEFRIIVLKLKRKLYYKTVLKPRLGTKEAQSNKVLEDYLEKINNVNILCKEAQKGRISTDLKKFPKVTRNLISNLLTFIATKINTKNIVDTTQYVDYIQNSFKVYPFVQSNSFNQE